MAALAFPLPANIVFALIGVPEQDFSQLKRWCGYRAELSWGRPEPGTRWPSRPAWPPTASTCADLVHAKAAAPGDDLASDLIAIHDEAPDRLTLEEIASILFTLSFAGHETTTGLISNTVRRLLEVPSRWAEIAAEPDLIPQAVEETLRYDPSVAVWRRVTTRPVTLAGVALPAGSQAVPVAGRRGPGRSRVR